MAQASLPVVTADVGGTFTDVTAVRADGTVASAKVLSTPADYSQGIRAGIEAVCGTGPNPPHLVIHGTTVATNAVLSGKGLGRAALVTTKGFRDILAIGRCKRPNLYDIDWDKPVPVVPRERIFEIDERIDGQGNILRAPQESDIQALAQQIRDSGVGVVAVCLLNAYANPANEQAVVKALQQAGCAASIFAATDLTREIQEYERMSTAALNAVLIEPVGSYLDRLSAILEERNAVGLLVMQSNGGVLPAKVAAQRPVALLESGPAAGVLGAAQLARALRLDKVIAFDMGGTTAKACLIEDGQPREAAEYQVGGELNTATPLLRGGGYPVRLPCLELCEVGAGGGSIAWVDEAGALRVGPHSAGSVPGPACYGKGGTEPTVADAQLVLGYLTGGALGGGSVELHPELARAAVQRHVADPLGVSVEQAAMAIFNVANATMGRAIRAVSVERGRDPSEYTLIAFGGSGPVHAASIAREIGIRQVIVPPFAGVFSALAMMTADIRRDAVVSLQLLLTGLEPSALARQFAGIESALRRDYEEMGTATDRLRFRRTLDMRYHGQAGRVEIAAPDDLSIDELHTRFEQQHEQLFGHLSPGDIVEIVALRVSALVPGAAADLGEAGAGSDAPAKAHRAYFEGGWQNAQIIDGRAGLATGGSGPLVITDANTTILVPPECVASSGAGGTIAITVPSTKVAGGDVSGLSMEIIRNRFEAIVDDMTMMLAQTARSVIAREGHDFSTAICSPAGELVAQGLGVLVHLGTVPYAVQAVRDRFQGSLHPGDIFLMNDPYEGGSHLPDFMLVAPIFAGGVLLGYALANSHQSDVGGGVPGGFVFGARDLFQEGMVIPPVRLVRGGELDDDIWRIVTRNTRAPRDVSGDLRAEIAACRKAESELRKLADEMGAEKIAAAAMALVDYTETLTRASVAQLPSGTWTATDYMDDDSNGNPVPLIVDLTIEGSNIKADFSRSSPQLASGLNTNAGVLASAVFMAFRSVLESRIPDNGGFMRCFTIWAEPGTVVSPRNPAPTSSRGQTALRLADLMYKVLAQVVPDKVWAAGEGGAAVITLSGRKSGAPWMVLDTLTGCSGGRPGKDGLEGSAPPIANSRNHSIEMMERDYPMRILEYSLVPDTGGAGRWRGGNAMAREYEILADAFVYARNDRRKFRPFGLWGGESGSPANTLLLRAGSTEWEQLKVVSTFDMRPGDRLRLINAGGGGFGPAAERDPAAIERDIVAGHVTPGRNVPSAADGKKAKVA